MIELAADPQVRVQVTYATRSGRVEVDAGPATADAVILVLVKGLFATLDASVKVKR